MPLERAGDAGQFHFSGRHSWHPPASPTSGTFTSAAGIQDVPSITNPLERELSRMHIPSIPGPVHPESRNSSRRQKKCSNWTREIQCCVPAAPSPSKGKHRECRTRALQAQESRAKRPALPSSGALICLSFDSRWGMSCKRRQGGAGTNAGGWTGHADYCVHQRKEKHTAMRSYNKK